jgi:hypothetical protein
MTKMTPRPSAAKTQAAKKASQSAGRQESVGKSWVGAQVPKEKEERSEVEELVWAMVGWGLRDAERVVCGVRVVEKAAKSNGLENTKQGEEVLKRLWRKPLWESSGCVRRQTSGVGVRGGGDKQNLWKEQSKGSEFLRGWRECHCKESETKKLSSPVTCGACVNIQRRRLEQRKIARGISRREGYCFDAHSYRGHFTLFPRH